jgi:AcrR family transcriptional regulator
VTDALDEAVRGAGSDPRARLLAYLTANFRAPLSDPDLLATWLGFWALTRSDPAIAHLQQEIYRDFRHGLERLIAEARPGLADARLAAVALSALIDGLWLELSLGQAPFTADEAAELAEKWLDALLG